MCTGEPWYHRSAQESVMVARPMTYSTNTISPFKKFWYYLNPRQVPSNVEYYLHLQMAPQKYESVRF